MVEKPLVEISEIFKTALVAYRDKDWNLAHEGFQRALRIVPADNPSQLYLKRIEKLQTSPLEEAWDGVTDFEYK
jgi:hypothetical protein